MNAETRAEVAPGVWLDARRALFFAATRTLVVADLHWGYAASHHATGNLLPRWGDEELAARLDALVADHAPAEVVWLGDGVHTLAGRSHAEAWLARWTPALPVHVLRGNHDRRWPAAQEHSLVRGPWLFHHGDRAVTGAPDAGVVEVVGHHHPAVSLRDGAGARVKLPALVVTARRWILPAFSPWAAGETWNQHLAPADTLWVVAPRRVFAVNSTLLSRLPSSP